MSTINHEISQLPIFQHVRSENLPSLLSCLAGHVKLYKKGEIIYLEEDEVRYIGVITKGNVLMTKEDVWGNETLLAYMGNGELFGETFAVRKETKSYVTYTASTDCRILFLSFYHILHACRNTCSFHQQVIVNVMELISRKNVKLMEKIEVTSKNTLREKILTYLSIQAQRQSSNHIEIGITRTELAAYLDSNRSAMTRELGAMKEEGLIDFDKKSFDLLTIPE